MASIDHKTKDFIEKTFKERFIYGHLYWVKQDYRYIQIKTPFEEEQKVGDDGDDTPPLHYEVVNGRIELHYEPEDYNQYYEDLIDFLMESTRSEQEYEWGPWNNGEWFRCAFIGEISDENFEDTIVNFIKKFDELINSFNSQNEPYTSIDIAPSTELPQLTETVELLHRNLREILAFPLRIPDYQRSYCWDESNVTCLLNDLSEHIENHAENPYRLGCIILHSHDGVYDIIDGQQRLVTLALLCAELKIRFDFLEEKFDSSESISNIAYNKSLVSQFCRRLKNNRTKFANSLLDNIEFSVLILQGEQLDLAYTFFSHQNSRGVGLTDYDLLKAHHLRYIPDSFDKQAYFVADIWNKMIEKGHHDVSEAAGRQNKQPDYEVVLDLYLFNLRKWMRYSPGGDDGTRNRIKREYEAAPVVEEIPPFGEKMYFAEPIQGGVHFFQWVQKHIDLYDTFANHPVVQGLRNTLIHGSDAHYRGVLEALLFEYYLKFGESYITEASLCFLRIITDHRYQNKRVTRASVLRYASKLSLVQLIDQSTSPTFVLAECHNITRNLAYPKMKGLTPIQFGMRGKARDFSHKLEQFVQIESFKHINV